MSGRRRAGVLALATAAGSLVFPPAAPRRRPAAALCRRPLLLPLRVATAEPEAWYTFALEAFGGSDD